MKSSMKAVISEPKEAAVEGERLAVSLKTLCHMLDASRSSVRRWLSEAGIEPIALGDGVKGAIRYRWDEVKAWLESRAHVK